MDQLIFGLYPVNDVAVHDQSLARYINLTTGLNLHGGARYSKSPVGKSINTIERLLNNLMRTEKWTGKKYSAYRVLRSSFEIIASKTKENPIQILINAIENAAPREEVTRLKYGGVAVPKAVDVAPSRRVSVALRNIALGATQASFKHKKSIENCLADELMLASKNEGGSFAVNRKDEIERISASAR